MNEMTDRILCGIDRINKHQEAELQSLCADPSPFNIALALTDSLLGTVEGVCCNYGCVIDGNGKAHDIHELMDELGRGIRETFQKLTGKAYQSLIVRQRAVATTPQTKQEGE